MAVGCVCTLLKTRDPETAPEPASHLRVLISNTSKQTPLSCPTMLPWLAPSACPAPCPRLAVCCTHALLRWHARDGTCTATCSGWGFGCI